jgi:NAD(P)-dependent dehydrogenase (short-subunit alcohol dehydrogenase family)
MTVSLEDRVILVTGTTSGLGKEMARLFARRGGLVVGTGRRQEVGEEIAEEINGAGGAFVFVVADIKDPVACRRAAEVAVKSYGRIDALVNNAAHTRPTPRIENMTDSDWRNTVETDLTGTFQMCRAVLPTMQDRHDGAIINIASTAAVHGLGNHAAYAAAKGGVLALTRVLATENLDRGIRANAILLGGVETEGFVRSMKTTGTWEEGESTGGILAKVRMKPASVAAAVALLCSEDAREITGSAVAIDRTASAGWHHAMMNQMSANGELPDSVKALGTSAKASPSEDN